MKTEKDFLDEKEILRIRIATIREKNRSHEHEIDRSIYKDIGWLTPPFNQDGMLDSI